MCEQSRLSSSTSVKRPYYFAVSITDLEAGARVVSHLALDPGVTAPLLYLSLTSSVHLPSTAHSHLHIAFSVRLCFSPSCPSSALVLSTIGGAFWAHSFTPSHLPSHLEASSWSTGNRLAQRTGCSQLWLLLTQIRNW